MTFEKKKTFHCKKTIHIKRLSAVKNHVIIRPSFCKTFGWKKQLILRPFKILIYCSLFCFSFCIFLIFPPCVFRFLFLSLALWDMHFFPVSFSPCPLVLFCCGLSFQRTTAREILRLLVRFSGPYRFRGIGATGLFNGHWTSLVKVGTFGHLGY